MTNQQDIVSDSDNASASRLSRQHRGDCYTGRGAKLRDQKAKTNLPKLIGAIDQGTSSTRFLVFENQTGHLIASSQMEIKRITPQEGWVEIDPNSIMASVYATMDNVYNQLLAHYNFPAGPTGDAIVGNLLSCIGICNQRESAVVWDSQTGEPLYNVIVWMDNRTKYIVDEMIDSIPGRDFNRFKDKTGLPMSTYFSAFKLKWLMDNVAEVKQALDEKRLLFGTVDSWILWNLTGGKHLTDVTNASRTFLMDIETLNWDKSLCKHFKVPLNILPQIKASADEFGPIQVGPFRGTPITGVIGDQSAALFGHNCLQIGQTKATFGTGCFIMQNIGPGPISGAMSGVHRDAKRGLITTVGYKLGDRPACYALEGSIKIAGAALTWLRDNIQLIENYEECDLLVNKTTHSAGVFFVPALGGLYSPYWDPNAAGLFIGLSQFSRREHLVRATFDSIAFQTNDILSLMRGVANGLMIDGGLCKSDNLCQILADITGYDIIRPAMCETSALGAAMVAGYGAGLWSYESLAAHGKPSRSNNNTSLNYQYHQHYPEESLSQSCHHHHHHHNHHPSHLHPAKQFCKPVMDNCQCLEGNNKNNKSLTSGNHHQQAQSSSSTSKFRSRTKSVTSNGTAARLRRTAAAAHSKQHHNRAALAALSQQHHRLHLKSANGVNDDAGGGFKEKDRGGGGGGGGGNDLDCTYEASHTQDQDETESQSISSSSQASPSAICQQQQQHQKLDLGQPTIPISPLESSLESSSDQGHQHEVSSMTIVQANAPPPPSSGYSSGDNFEQAASLSGLSSIRGRVDSPMSHLTDNSAGLTSNSVTPSMDLNLVNMTANLHHHQQQQQQQQPQFLPEAQPSSLITKQTNGNGNFEEEEDMLALPEAQPDTGSSWRRKLKIFPHNLKTYLAQQPAILLGKSYHHQVTEGGDQESSEKPFSENIKRDEEELEEDDEDLVHEFGGRDSYGEDGYDSSNASFDSYTSEDDDGDGDCEGHHELRQPLNNNAIESTDEDKQQQTMASRTAHRHSRTASLRRQRNSISGATSKQMDVFQPYISLDHRTDLVETWSRAVERSMQWTKVHHEEVKRIDYQRLSSLPISMYLFFSIGMVALSGVLATTGSLAALASRR